MSWKSNLRVVLGWAVGMGWHLVQIARGRPDFARVADDGRLLRSLAALGVCASILRHAVMGDAGVFNTVTQVLIYGLVLAILFVREHRSMSLLAMAFGASALVDLVVSAAVALGAPFPHGTWALCVLAIEVFLVWRVMKSFASAPARVQARGYRP